MTDTALLARWRSWTPYLLGILRIAAGFLFIEFGTAKLFAFPGPLMPGGGAVPLATLPGTAGVIETIGGALIIIGLFTRPVAFVLSGEMAVAYFHAHAPHGFWPVLNGGSQAALYSFLFLYLSAAGAGAFSVDAARRRGRP